MTNATLRGKPDAGNPHVRFDEGEVASAKPRRGSLLYNVSGRFRLVFASLLLAASVAEAETVLCVSPGGTGDGSSWSTAAGLEAAVATARVGTGEYALHLKGGLYTPSATIRLSNGISLYGGYTGVGATRDLVNSETIISGDAAKDDVWAHIDGATGTFDADNKKYPTTLPKIVENDKIVVPAFQGDHDTYAPYTTQFELQPLTNNLLRVLTVQADSTNTLDGITIACGGTGGWKGYSSSEDGYTFVYGTGLLVSDGAKATINNVRVVAACAYGSVVYFGGTENKPSTVTVTGLKVEHCRGCERAVVDMTDFALVTMSDCTFTGNAHVGEYYDKNFYFGSEGHATVLRVHKGMTELVDTSFERNVELKQGWYQADHSCASVLWLPYNAEIGKFPDKLKNLVFRNNAIVCGKGRPFPVIWLDNRCFKLTGCLFENNLCTSKGVNKGRTDSDVGSLIDMPTTVYGSGYDADFVLKESTVVSNKVVIVPDTNLTALYAAPVLTRGYGAVVNCTFLDNTVTLSKAAPAGCSVNLSRGVMSVKLNDYGITHTMQIHVENSTFAGEAPLPDVVDVGDTYAKTCSFVGNSILWATGAGAAVPRAAGSGDGVGNGVEIARCIVRAPELLGTGVRRSDAVSGTDPLLEPLGYVKATDPVPVMRPALKTPALTAAYDIRCRNNTSYGLYAYSYGYGVGTGTYRDRLDNQVTKDHPLIADALGNARPTGGFLLGAMQTTANVVRARPACGGTVNGEELLVGEIPASVTAAAKAGYTFHSWRDADGVLLSTSPTYSPVPSAAGEVFCEAVFTPDDNALTLAPGEDIQEAIDTLAYCNGPQTLTLGAGRYPVYKSISIAQKEKLTVKGEGNVLLTSDPAGLAYWLNDAGVAKTSGGTNLLVFAADGTFNEPRPEAGELYWKTSLADMTSRTTFLLDMTAGCADAGAGTTLVFSNVTFALGRLVVGAAETTFDSCRILAGGTANDEKIVDCRTNLTMVGSSFVGNFGRGIDSEEYIVSTYTKAHVCLWSVKDCDFRLNAGGVLRAGPCLNSYNGDPLVVDTLFASNVVYTANATPLVFGRDKTSGVISGCTFVDNLYTNTTASMLSSPYAGTLIVSNCCFRGNRQYNSSFSITEKTSDAGRKCAWGALLSSQYTPVSVYGSSFLSNVVVVTGTPEVAVTNAFAAIVGCIGGSPLVNSYLEGNVARASAPARAGLTVKGVTYLAQGKGRYPLTGTAFCNNDVDSDMFVVRWSNLYEWYVQNCIFWGDDASYVPFAWADATLDLVNFWNCVIRNAPDNTQGEAKTVVRSYGCRSADPKFGPLTERDGRFYRPLQTGSGAKRCGTQVGTNASGTSIFYRSDVKAWCECAQPWKAGGVLVADATDMFGTYARTLARPDAGPVQQTVPVQGLSLIVR